MGSKKKARGVKSAIDARTGKRVSAKTAKRRPATTMVTVSHTKRLKGALNKILTVLDDVQSHVSPSLESVEDALAKIKKIAQEAL
jgi:hypothetical protein